MKWIRFEDSNYYSEDGQFWVHRMWVEENEKGKHRTSWTLCIREGQDWNVLDDVRGFAVAKKLAEQFIEEES